MKQVDTMRKEQAKRRRRRHSAQFKAQAIEACAVPGASVAAVALEYGLNANLLRRWLKHSAPGKTGAVAAVARKPAASLTRSDFVPVMVEAAPPGGQPIRIEVRRASTLVNIEWPVHAASDCAAWLREWMR
jgi:transposase